MLLSAGLMEKGPWLPGCTYIQPHLHPWLGTNALLTRTFLVAGWSEWEAGEAGGESQSRSRCDSQEGKQPVWEGEQEGGGKWLEVLRKTAGCSACPPETFSTPGAASCSWNCCSCRVSAGLLQELALVSPAALPPRLAPRPRE